MRFVADGMLGRFARWLRLLGCEVEYMNDASDERLMEIAEREERVLLTRDVELHRRARGRGIEAHLVEGRNEPERLANVARRFGIMLEVDTSISRCPTCNSPIKPVVKSEVEDRIPPTTRRIYDEFWVCTGCGKVYWQGGHWKKINEVLARANKILESQGS
ncbi:MAG: Mut7-C RNAse domain-containing protein [Candidatus Bathyarchaeia archaeon]